MRPVFIVIPIRRVKNKGCTRNPRQYVTRTECFALDEPDEKAPARITLANNTLIEIARDIFGKTYAITRSGDGKSATRSYTIFDEKK